MRSKVSEKRLCQWGGTEVEGVMCSMKTVRAPLFWVVDSSRMKRRWAKRRSVDMVV